MAKEYTISELMQLAGIRGYLPGLSGAIKGLLSAKNQIEYEGALKQATVEIKGYNDVEIYDNSEAEGGSEKSVFGLPIYSPLVLGDVKDLEDMLFDSALIDVSRQKNIVVTTVQGRDSSVKEFINNGDYAISVSGLLAHNKVGYPFDLVTHFNAFMEHKGSIPIVHEVLNSLGIYELVVTDYNLPKSNFQNVQAYSFNAISEEPAVLTIDD